MKHIRMTKYAIKWWHNANPSVKTSLSQLEKWNDDYEEFLPYRRKRIAWNTIIAIVAIAIFITLYYFYFPRISEQRSWWQDLLLLAPILILLTVMFDFGQIRKETRWRCYPDGDFHGRRRMLIGSFGLMIDDFKSLCTFLNPGHLEKIDRWNWDECTLASDKEWLEKVTKSFEGICWMTDKGAAIRESACSTLAYYTLMEMRAQAMRIESKDVKDGRKAADPLREKLDTAISKAWRFGLIAYDTTRGFFFEKSGPGDTWSESNRRLARV